MSRPSPQTTRVVDTINLLTEAAGADGRGMGLTLSEIARDLPANISSCVHLLAALTASGWVVRDPHTKRYRVGPALVRPGQLASERHPLLVVLREEMSALSSELDRPVLAFQREWDAGDRRELGGRADDERALDHPFDRPFARLIAVTWPRGQLAPPLRIGDTVPIVAPLGALFTAWQRDPEIRSWLASIEEPVHRERLAEDLVIIREAGYAVERDLQGASNDDLEALVDGRPSPYRDRLLYGILAGPGDDRRVLTDLERDEEHVVHGICAPVHIEGAMEVGLYVVGFTGPLRADEIGDIGRAARAAADRATGRLAAGFVDCKG